MRSIFTLTCLLLLFCNCLKSQTLSREVMDRVKKATVYIQLKLENPVTGEETGATGTGFFISEAGYIVTNYHVIQPVQSIYKLSYPSPVSDLNIILHSGTQKHKSYKGRVIAVDKKNDLAILALPNKNGRLGFATSHLRAVLHQMNIRSVSE